jgi:hypothetical protein
MQLATFGQIASFVEPRSGQRLPIRYLAYALDDGDLTLLAASLVERVGDGGWARQLPGAEVASALRPRLFVLMAMRAAEGVTFVGAGAQMLLDRGVTAMWSGEQAIDALITLGDGGGGA